MIDAIKTLKNLNKKFPRFQLNTLLDILDCIEEKEESTIWYPPTITPSIYTPTTITCTDLDTSECKPEYTSASTCDNQMLFEPKKHHVKDKTSKNVRILTEEVPADVDEEMNIDDIKSLYKETVDLFQDYLSKLDMKEVLQ